MALLNCALQNRGSPPSWQVRFRRLSKMAEMTLWKALLLCYREAHRLFLSHWDLVTGSTRGGNGFCAVGSEASPSTSVSRPANMRRSVDLPEPLQPKIPILAPKKSEGHVVKRRLAVAVSLSHPYRVKIDVSARHAFSLPNSTPAEEHTDDSAANKIHWHDSNQGNTSIRRCHRERLPKLSSCMFNPKTQKSWHSMNALRDKTCLWRRLTCCSI